MDNDFKACMYAKLDAIKEDVVEIKENVKEQNSRVRTLENWRAKLVGAICIIVILLTWTVPTLAKIVLGS